MHWIGSDVVNARANFKKGNFQQNYIDQIHHFCEVPWIQQELGEIGIKADIVQLFTYDKPIDPEIKFPEKFSILSYAAKGKESILWIGKLIRLAKDFPDIAIKITNLKLQRRVAKKY